MRHLAFAFVALVAACSSSSSSTSPTTTTDAGTTSSGGDAAVADLPAASTTAATIGLNGGCATFQACGGSFDGTYDYVGGCTDAFATSKQQCPGMDTSKLTSTVTGSVYFIAGGALKRHVITSITGTITIPASCIAGGGGCAVAEQGLKTNGVDATCSGTTSCDCTVSKTDTVINQTSYTVSGSTITTGDGESYAFCATGADLSYQGATVGAEQGTYTLKKR